MKIICVGRNYGDHIQELGNQRPEEPVLFMKPDSAVILKNNPFIIPNFSEDIHYEVEILVKIKKIGKYIDRVFAQDYYDEIGLGIDFTARDLQSVLKSKGLPWERAKGFDGSAMIGSFVDKSLLGNLEELDFESELSICSQRIDFVSSNLINFGWLFSPRMPYKPSNKSPYIKGNRSIWVIPNSAIIKVKKSAFLGSLFSPYPLAKIFGVILSIDIA